MASSDASVTCYTDSRGLCDECHVRPRARRPRAKFCSDGCRYAHANKANPVRRQAALDFALPAKPTQDRIPTAPVEGEPFEASRIWLLGRLQRGPVSTLELRSPPWLASMNPAQRVYELRQRQHDIRTEREGKDYRYALYVDGVRVER